MQPSQKKTSVLSYVLLLVSVMSPLQAQPSDSLWKAGEKHLKNIRQLTYGGQNAEAYFSFSGTKLVFQSQRDSFLCDQIFTMNLDGSAVKLVSTGKGRTTCSYFLPGDTSILYASTHLAGDACPPAPDRKKGYVWQLYPSYDIFIADVNGGITQRLTNTPGYDAEAVVSPKGDKIVFTSLRNGDLDIYTMNLDGSDVRQLTHELGYDGGPFFSPDGKRIVYRAYHPSSDKEIADYKELLKEEKIKPMNLQICVMDADGSHKRQVTHNNAANFGPYFHPDGEHIIFASNMSDTSRIPMNFDLFMVKADGSHLEQITFNETFDGFPMFSRDGKQLVFASNRNGKARWETNIFIANWEP
ncbi:MAG: PD40 domain-containing protein [Ignavibacteriae bacterium]|nr:PD40 domain-containing protein [Ignavibacteria bacterium]MBI3365787.1 PD40 domain-containing protein [Ignavibacteriota bacterium]